VKFTMTSGKNSVKHDDEPRQNVILKSCQPLLSGETSDRCATIVVRDNSLFEFSLGTSLTLTRGSCHVWSQLRVLFVSESQLRSD
jgi:hypothetical protein